jgi:hypothetical protein
MFTERSRNNVHFVQHPVTVTDSSSAFAVKANGVDLVDKRQGTVFSCNVA